jgi:hypothetical protein
MICGPNQSAPADEVGTNYFDAPLARMLGLKSEQIIRRTSGRGRWLRLQSTSQWPARAELGW